jgi:hypothetical protein
MIKKYFMLLFLYSVTFWDLYTLSNEIKTLLNHHRHIVTYKQYRYNVRYKYLSHEQ